MSGLIAFGFVAGTAAFIWLGIHYGGKWIDRKLGVVGPVDPSRPIVRGPDAPNTLPYGNSPREVAKRRMKDMSPPRREDTQSE